MKMVKVVLTHFSGKFCVCVKVDFAKNIKNCLYVLQLLNYVDIEIHFLTGFYAISWTRREIYFIIIVRSFHFSLSPIERFMNLEHQISFFLLSINVILCPQFRPNILIIMKQKE